FFYYVQRWQRGDTNLWRQRRNERKPERRRFDDHHQWQSFHAARWNWILLHKRCDGTFNERQRVRDWWNHGITAKRHLYYADRPEPGAPDHTHDGPEPGRLHGNTQLRYVRRQKSVGNLHYCG